MRLTENFNLKVPESSDTLEDSLPMLQYDLDTIDFQLQNLTVQLSDLQTYVDDKLKNIASFTGTVDGGRADTVPDAVIDGGGAF